MTDKTLWERIEEWRKWAAKVKESAPSYSLQADGWQQCADELIPIADALEAVVREMRMGDTYIEDGWADRLERIVGKGE